MIATVIATAFQSIMRWPPSPHPPPYRAATGSTTTSSRRDADDMDNYFRLVLIVSGYIAANRIREDADV